MIKVYAANSAGKCSELPVRISSSADVEELYLRFSERFPRVKEIIDQVAGGGAGPEAVVRYIGQSYRVADPSLAAIPPETDTGYDSWCPRDSEGSTKYWDRVPLNAMINVDYFNCLYAAALTARAFSEIECEFSLLMCAVVPTHPYIILASMPGRLFSFHHDGLQTHDGGVEIRDFLYTPESLTPISDYGVRDGVYGLSIPEHFLIPARLVPAPDNVDQAIGAFDGLAAGLDSFPQLGSLAKVIRLSIIPRLRSGPIPFTRTIS